MKIRVLLHWCCKLVQFLVQWDGGPLDEIYGSLWMCLSTLHYYTRRLILLFEIMLLLLLLFQLFLFFMYLSFLLLFMILLLLLILLLMLFMLLFLFQIYLIFILLTCSAYTTFVLRPLAQDYNTGKETTNNDIEVVVVVKRQRIQWGRCSKKECYGHTLHGPCFSIMVVWVPTTY